PHSLPGRRVRRLLPPPGAGPHPRSALLPASPDQPLLDVQGRTQDPRSARDRRPDPADAGIGRITDRRRPGRQHRRSQCAGPEADADPGRSPALLRRATEHMNQQLSIGIQGMTCAACVGRIERALKKQSGVVDARVNLATEKAVVDVTDASARQLVAAIADAGYQPVTATAEFGVHGMTCATCVSRVERVLNKLPGVLEASVNLATERDQVRFLPELVSPPRLQAAVRDAGYQPRDLSQPAAPAADDGERDALRRQVWFAAAFTIPLVIVGMGKMTPGLEQLFMQVMPHRGWMWLEWL